MKGLKRVWWIIGLRGLLAVLFGLLALLWPDHTIYVVITLFGAFALANGLFAIGAGLRSSDRKDFMRASLLDGIFGVLIGLYALLAPESTTRLLVYLVAVWALVFGLSEVFVIDKTERVTLNDWHLGLFGIVSIVSSLLLFLFPRVAAVILVWFVGFYALILGGLLLSHAWRVYKHQHPGPQPPHHLPLAH